MEKLSNSSHFLDLGGLDSLRAQAQKDEKGALKEAAKQFEGIFIQMLMKSMRDANAVFKADSPLNSQTTEFFEQMRDQQMSLDLSNKGMLGLAELMVQQLSPEDSPITPASVLRGNTPQTSSSVNVTGQADETSAKLNQPVTSAATSAFVSPKAMDAILSGDILVSQAQGYNGNNLPLSAQNPMETQVVNANQPSEVSRFKDPQHFISVLYPHAEKAAKSLGTTPEVLIAQSALETGWGQKVIRRPDGNMSNNLFNIKADKRWQGDKTSVNTLEFEKGVAVQQRADFRMYDSLEQSFEDFVSFISQNDRYQDARSVASEPKQFIHALQKAGYATDPHYAKKVINVMSAVKEGLKAVLPGESK
ncbi:flagellar assembly peptidoglycan hydrolase FlgJ [Shewanella gaetbuli]|uniref:Peptidoglycan hydrolase FlgJ n=1 Tax=Shewanella gaetbuli TaxID=220752 RepID=A0A9X1ZHN1_9GAMM|nr:flagellar assembly peptidoglycan hydrolase FlgJ [Shewanella gaetbuli]MCL1141701.1 flagellar assembly peptidoglycan hydrolase FlgJ [Shewanella gaetbuli]